nr:MAG TPA: hypothetical protein [Caudoviricetes sp.]
MKHIYVLRKTYILFATKLYSFYLRSIYPVIKSYNM